MQNVKIMQKYTSQLPYQAEHPQPKRHIGRATLLTGFGALIIILPLLAISVAVILFQVRQMNLPGVIIYDQEVGLMTLEDTLDLMDSTWNENRSIQLVSSQNQEITFELTPGELGYWVDPQATASAAYGLGRDADPFIDILSAAKGESQVIMPVLYFNQNNAQQTLTAISETLSIPAEEASIAYQDSTWVALPGKPGQSVDIEKTLDDLYQNAFTILQTQSVTLYVEPLEPVINDLSAVLGTIESVLSQELSLQAYDPITDEKFVWSVPKEIKQTWITVNAETFDVTLTPDQDSVQTLLDTWESELGQERTWEEPPQPKSMINQWANGEILRVTLRHHPTTYRVGAGESLWSISLKLGMPMWHIMDANEGLTIDNIEAGMTLTIPSKNVLLPLPVVLDKRIVVDISEQRMTVYENGQVRNTHIISTGMANSPTMAGIFQIQTHEINAYASNWDLYMPHFMGIYEAWPGFMNGIHGLPILSNGQRLWENVLGSPASYGCIILNLFAAEDLYYWAEAGVVVEIRQ